ncbi:large ribosomal subunit protein uL29m [Genypterus blacodes]|uniref:large ribosomal subunit protein uL29m n=1 Tax=Genypterus blacodes TaxID=154954 RepID=UPI003F763530
MAASSSAGRVLSFCRQFQNVCRISSAVTPQRCVTKLSRYQPRVYNVSGSVAPCRFLHSSSSYRGLDEFFDLPDNWGESTVKSGAPWTAKQLRTKSNEDLHKLWYVLLKEKNLLLTLEQEARRHRVQMPSPERLNKVEQSMTRLDTVVQEREAALRLLQTGQERARPGAWRKNIFGHVYWYRFREHPIPWYMNRRYKRRRFFTPKFVEPYIRLRIEQHLRAKARKDRLQKQKLNQLKLKFPDTKVPA